MNDVAALGSDTPSMPRGWRGSADLWLDAAYDALVDGGVEAVRVMPLAQGLGLSRTSFYWHFPDRQALLDALVLRWQDKNTVNLLGRTTAYADTITEAVFNVFDCWITPALFDSRLEFAIRNWAQTAPALAQVLVEADRQRLAALRAMFARFGFSDGQSDIRARTLYLTQIGYITMQTAEPLDDRIRAMPDYIETFTGCPPSPAEVARFVARNCADLAL
jgi:AcrR family transcriptional regulator